MQLQYKYETGHTQANATGKQQNCKKTLFHMISVIGLPYYMHIAHVISQISSTSKTCEWPM